MVVVCRGGGLGLLCSDGHMGLDRGLALFGWQPGAVRAASLSTWLDRLWAMQRLIWLVRRGGGPEGMVLGWRLGDLCGQRVCRPGWFVSGQCGGRSGWYVGAAAPELEVCLLR